MSKKIREWLIPMSVTLKVTAIVKARTEDEAKATAKSGAFEIAQENDLTDWDVDGEPELNE